ncbi:ATP synthase F1 subunit delta [Dethiosulfatarculus sandiegensis]|uniref:ATP synthase subunit delta n=1 Tax=Dethiosulfatarculus sandiegensis TaxID=1429043 RepID=A0A0D2JYC0_9BACT|nr:ATP synthase F1 subunit delta [Dethiosulfatarculus sandiegensis]KIX14520.1 ATP synthase subunit delta [Dethiosulfatarculus sandiegensis]
MTSQIVAKRYAKALLEIGREDGLMEQYGRELVEMAALLTDTADLMPVLANPVFELESRKAILETIVEKMGLSPIVANFFKLLLDRRRITAAADISLVYAGLLDEAKGITRAEVSSAAPLSDDEVSGISEVLRQVAGQEVQVEVKEDPSLIGGVIARIGDLVLDGSVKSQLQSLRESLRRGEYA